jgi:hypothetical protein
MSDDNERLRDKQRDPVGTDGHGKPLIYTEEEAERLSALIEKARKSGKREDWAAAGVIILPNPPADE